MKFFHFICCQQNSDINISLLSCLYQYVKELIQFANDSICKFANYIINSLICGEYRSRTDDLLRARQAL
jgi:hypothetical protein